MVIDDGEWMICGMVYCFTHNWSDQQHPKENRNVVYRYSTRTRIFYDILLSYFFGIARVMFQSMKIDHLAAVIACFNRFRPILKRFFNPWQVIFKTLFGPNSVVHQITLNWLRKKMLGVSLHKISFVNSKQPLQQTRRPATGGDHLRQKC